jgi:hypothetical protein
MLQKELEVCLGKRQPEDLDKPLSPKVSKKAVGRRSPGKKRKHRASTSSRSNSREKPSSRERSRSAERGFSRGHRRMKYSRSNSAEMKSPMASRGAHYGKARKDSKHGYMNKKKAKYSNKRRLASRSASSSDQPKKHTKRGFRSERFYPMHQGPSSDINRTSSSRDNTQGISKEKRRPKDGVMMQHDPQTLTHSQSQLEPTRAQGMAGLKSLFTNQADPRFTNQEVLVYEMTPEQQSRMGMPNN